MKIDRKILKQIPNKQTRIIAVDTETNGGANEDNHILEIAAIEIINGKITEKIFHGYIKPRIKIKYNAMLVHKI
jgi:DNA polymerase III epsilon subunit-like protein